MSGLLVLDVAVDNASELKLPLVLLGELSLVDEVLSMRGNTGNTFKGSMVMVCCEFGYKLVV